VRREPSTSTGCDRRESVFRVKWFWSGLPGPKGGSGLPGPRFSGHGHVGRVGRSGHSGHGGHGGPCWPQWCIGHCEHDESRRSQQSLRAQLATAARLTRRALRGQVTWIATRPKAGKQRAAQTDVAASAARGDHNFGSASESFVSERLQRGEQWRPGQLARRLSEGLPATAVTAGTVLVTVTVDAGITAPGYGDTAPVTAPPTAFTAPVTAIAVTASGQRARFPRRCRPPGQRLSPSHCKA
jgi:hypothetical protein